MTNASRAPAPGSATDAFRGRVLLVDDEPNVLLMYGKALTQAGYEVVTANAAAAALAAIADQQFDVVLSDIIMPEMDGVRLLRAVREKDFDLPVVLITASPNLSTAVEAVDLGALRYLTKPVDLDLLVETAAYGTQVYRLARIKRDAMRAYGTLPGGAGDLAGMEIAFNRALAGLWLAYQPIVTWGGRRVWGFEALARTREPTLTNPLALFDAAERLRRIHHVGRAVRDQAAKTAVSLPDGVNLLVNLHPRELIDECLYAADSPLARVAERVVLEITERVSLEEIDNLGVRLQRLRQLGFRLAVDDLGAGYSGLETFVRVAPEVVKIDMSLVRGVDQDERRRSLVSAMHDVCRRLGAEVVLEGVETATEAATLIELGCDLMQGYHFAKPTPEPVFVDL